MICCANLQLDAKLHFLMLLGAHYSA